MRTIVELREDQLRRIDQLRAAKRISRAAAVREAVDRYLADELPKESEQAFGVWRGRVDAVTYQRRIRAEWDR